MILCVLAEMGGGKTLFSTWYAKLYRNHYGNNIIYANYKLNLPNCVYTPNVILPFSELSDCLIIVDDCYAISNKGFINIAVNISRKKNVEMILTAQYYTMISKLIRTLSTIVNVFYVKERNAILCYFVFNAESTQQRVYKKVLTQVDSLFDEYDTEEVVKFPTFESLIEEIATFSKTKSDIEQNIYAIFSSKSERKNASKRLQELRPELF